MTEPEALKMIAVMTAALPREWSFLSEDQRKATSAIYVRMLADLPYPAANAGVESLLASAEKMPTIAEVRAATLRVMGGTIRPGIDAWGDVRKLATYRNVGDVSGTDETVLRVCRAMGWIKHRTITRGGVDVEQWCVAFGEDANESADRARFCEAYDYLAREHRYQQNVSQLPAAQRYRALQAAEQQQLEVQTQPSADGPRRVDFAALLPGEIAQ